MLNEYGSPCLSATFAGTRPAFALADGTVRRPGSALECVQVHAVPSLVAVPLAAGELLTSGEDGRVCRADPDGAAREIAAVPRKWITALDERRGRVAYAAGKTVWLLARGEGPARALDHPRNVRGVAFSADGERLAVAHQDAVSVHDTADGAGDGSPPLALAWNDIHTASTFSPDGRFLVVAAQNGFLHGWRLADRKHFRMLGYQARVDAWSWSHDGVLLATTGAAAAIVWPFDGADGPMTKSAYELGARAGRSVRAVAWRPAVRELAIGWDDGCVQLVGFDAAGAPATLRAAGRAPITSLAWDEAGARLAFGTAAGECGTLEATA